MEQNDKQEHFIHKDNITYCPKCHSDKCTIWSGYFVDRIICLNCGYEDREMIYE